MTKLEKVMYLKVKWWWPLPSFLGVGAASPLVSLSFWPLLWVVALASSRWWTAMGLEKV